MAIQSSRITVNTTPTLLGDYAGLDNNPSTTVTVINSGTAAIRVGGPEVTWAQGAEIPVGGNISVDVNSNDQLYAIATGSAVTGVTLLQVGK